jgi:hypothetical protein
MPVWYLLQSTISRRIQYSLEVDAESVLGWVHRYWLGLWPDAPAGRSLVEAPSAPPARLNTRNRHRGRQSRHL